tara:strand:+ start:553 stop:759 length:207 start_codon:yes stop_codon:yes gene_type:complete
MQLSVIVVSEGHHAEQWTSSSLPTAQKTPTHIPFGTKEGPDQKQLFSEQLLPTTAASERIFSQGKEVV